MKRGLYIFIILIAGCSGKITITEADIKTDIFYPENCIRPFTGKCVVVFSNTCLIKEEFTYKRGLLHGKATSWYRNGHIKRLGSYKGGKISGKWEFWDENGNKKLEANYRDDALNGLYISLFANGKIKEKGRFANNKRLGQWQYYNENGEAIPAGSK